MKKSTFILVFLLIFVHHIAAYSQEYQVSAETETSVFDDHITIDGRTYKVSPDFEIPAGIDKDTPVKLNFSDQTHELLSIERLIEDDSNNNEMEYHFGIVNAITRANTDLEYRVYGTGLSPASKFPRVTIC